jgi:hypothetical protein
MLDELERFLASPVRWTVPVLRDAQTDRVIAAEGMSIWGEVLTAALAADGDVVVTDSAGNVKLRSWRLEQRVVEWGADGHPLEVELRDLDGGDVVRGGLVLGRDDSQDPPTTRLQVSLEPRGPRDYEDIAGRLRGLLEVAVANGRPVRWA